MDVPFLVLVVVLVLSGLLFFQWVHNLLRALLFTVLLAFSLTVFLSALVLVDMYSLQDDSSVFLHEDQGFEYSFLSSSVVGYVNSTVNASAYDRVFTVKNETLYGDLPDHLDNRRSLLLFVKKGDIEAEPNSLLFRSTKYIPSIALGGWW